MQEVYLKHSISIYASMVISPCLCMQKVLVPLIHCTMPARRIFQEGVERLNAEETS